MAVTISNIRSLKGAGILGDRNAKSGSLHFRKLNLIYGFNGSGKSTFSRIFASLEEGRIHSKLPSDCTFDLEMDNGSVFGCPTKPNGLERQLLVFNTDFQEKNLQWAIGQANPVFFIGEEQAEAAERLSELEAKIRSSVEDKTTYENDVEAAKKTLSAFKRERAKVTAPRLHWGNRKYEARQLEADYEQWKGEELSALSDEELSATEDTLRLEEPMPLLGKIGFNFDDVSPLCASIIALCGQSISGSTLEELKRFPEMLLWVKQGLEFHTEKSQATCLYCGNSISKDRQNALAAALDNKIDQFLDELRVTRGKFDASISKVNSIGQAIPSTDSISPELRAAYKEQRLALSKCAEQVKGKLAPFGDKLAIKTERPATPVDTASLVTAEQMANEIKTLSTVVDAINGLIENHNKSVSEFASRKDQASVAIRKHYIAECREEFTSHLKAQSDADSKLSNVTEALEKLGNEAGALREKVRTHGPAATAINKLIASYLGHSELTISPVDKGYEIHRHGQAISGLPSEGEKTAIAISYFLSTIESDGRKLKDMIVVIDDPVSSLDSKALNYACSLIRSRLSGAAQLFILTHNQQCMNEFRKAWKNLAKPPEGKEPTATFLFMDVAIPNDQGKRIASIIEMSKLLREYDSEYHFLFSHVLKFSESGDNYYDHGYMMPNILRRVLDVFLAFRCPGNSGLPSKIDQLCVQFPAIDKDKLSALERLSQVESHSDNLDDLVSFSSMTIEETKQATNSLLQMMKDVDPKHLAGLERICR